MVLDSKLSDTELINSFLKGNKQALNILLKKYSAQVYSYIFIMLKNQDLAKDFLQETYIKVFNSLKSGKYTEKGAFLYWVLRIAHNLVIDYYRRNKSFPTISNDSSDYDFFNSLSLSEKNIEQELIETQTNKDLRELINKLPAEQKEVILLRHYGGLSFKEIAKITNVSINTALGRMRYALINLRKLIEQYKVNLNTH